MTDIPEQEVLRYLRAGTAKDPALSAQVHALCAEMKKSITPHYVVQEYECTITTTRVTFGDTAFESFRLAHHLSGCRSLLLFAATLGFDAIRVIRTEQMRSMARGAIADAAASAMIEQFCDDVQNTLADTYEKRGLYLRPRFSPGYGDFALASQQDFFRLLELRGRLALTLSPDFIMSPSKSVTAVIGLTEDPSKSFRRPAAPRSSSLSFRREGAL